MLKDERRKAYSRHEHVSSTVFFSVAALFGAVMDAREDEAAEQLIDEGNYRYKICLRKLTALFPTERQYRGCKR